MTLLLGNSGSPRWYNGPPERLEHYLHNLERWGATSVEMVLHHGPADERTARVHVLQDDWLSMVERYRDRGIQIQFHVSLDPRFATYRWMDDRAALQREYGPVLDLVTEVARDQGRSSLVIHGSEQPDWTSEQNILVTQGLMDWLVDRLAADAPGAVVALELGAWKPSRPTASARSRSSALAVVDAIDSPQVGICWDIAHDHENGLIDPDWQPLPPDDFLRRVVHVHLHDLDEHGASHFPLTLGRVEFTDQIAALQRLNARAPITLEIRWLHALRLGKPWEMLAASYAEVYRRLPPEITGGELR